jgi:hypothetical protein
LENDILRIITEWDPMGLANIAPNDEYLKEANLIKNFIDCNAKLTVEELSEFIKNVFIEYFGEDEFTANEKEIKDVAKTLLIHN